MTKSIAIVVAVAMSLTAAQAAEKPGQPKTAEPAKTKTVAFLGVATEPLAGALRSQLDLPEGVGLLVERISPAGPAAKAGVSRFDVLHKLDDQLLINHEQLAVLVRMHKPGDQVKLTIIRKAKPVVKAVKLGGQAVPAGPGLLPRLWKRLPRRLDWPNLRIERRRLGEMEKQLERRLREVVPQQFRRWGEKVPAKPGAPVPGAKKPAKPRRGSLSFSVTIRTGDYTVTVTAKDGCKAATVRDSAGKVLHKDVPAEKWHTLPEEVRTLLKGIKIDKQVLPSSQIRIRI